MYLLLERTEKRNDGSNKLRITRVGTHALSDTGKATLYDRLYEHRGVPGKSDNHRRSILRKHVGRALIAREGIDLPSRCR